MASPVTTRTVRPLDTLRFDISGPPQITEVVADHLRLLGAQPEGPGRPSGPPSATAPAGHTATAGHTVLTGGGFAPAEAATRWAAPGSGIADEATVQAASGIMAVHGRRDGAPRGLAADYAATATGILTVQGLLAGLLAQARGCAPARTATRADHAGLLAVSQYLAAAGADEAEAVTAAPGGPPFTSAEGLLFELETLDAGVWAAFWRALDAPADALRAGWRPFQFRYATACAPLPDALHRTTRAHAFERIRQAAAAAGADVCVLRTLAERAAEHDGAAPWTLEQLPAPPADPETPVRRRPAPSPGRPLAGLTVVEAGRRIQAPLAAHLLGLLGAEVIRVEPPGGDPLRGMPPACSGTSARWLALNRGKQAVEIDIKAPGDRHRLYELVAGADVFLHNWAPGKAAGLGLDAEHLTAVQPALVYAYTSGWAGRIGDAPLGTDFMVQARTGVGEAVRPDGEPPAPSLMTLLDVLGGLTGAEAVLAGLLLRERTGRGVRVDSSLLGAADLLTAPALRRAAAGGEPRRPAGFRRPLPTADGWIAAGDACAAVVAAVADAVRELPTDEAVHRLQARGLTAAAVTTDLAALHHDPRFAGSIGLDAHGAPAVPDPWSFV
ncbi:CoA transferase [Streptomyces sp. NPDC007369]|uniref:CoA transferase n=1 Tax=Streptomyces sp. NPDC007369 TaxID=3154589 RepID=UPI0033C1520B